MSRTVRERSGVASPSRGTFATHRLALLCRPVRNQIVGRIERCGIIEKADPQGREGAQPEPRATIGTAHFEKCLEANLGEGRRYMVGPVAQARDFARQRRQPAGDEIAEGNCPLASM